MGTYLNPGPEGFNIIYNGDIFIDKTEMIAFTNSVVNKPQRFIAVSRPRRFGKSVAADMLTAYYGEGDSRSLFKNCKISDLDNWDEFLNKFDVIRLVMTDFINNGENVIDSLQTIRNRVIDELEELQPNVKYDYKDLTFSMDKYYRKTGKKFVIIIDEWDAVFRECKGDNEGQIKYLDFLRNWMKDKTFIALAYMTGILPIKKYGKHSALNMFDEYSMLQPMQLAPYTGFTEDEVKELCNEYEMVYEDVSDWYDGYSVSNSIPIEKRRGYREGTYKEYTFSIYSPLSVINAMRSGFIRNYWNKTENYEALADFISMNQAGLKDAIVYMMEGNRLKIDIRTYQNDMTTFHNRDDVLTLLVHIGYLGYDSDTGEVFIPNKEILDEFKSSTKTDEWLGSFKALKNSQELLDATWNQDTDRVAEILEYFHDTADNKSYNSEAALSYAVQVAYYYAQKYYTIIPEPDSGKGYVDLAYIPALGCSDKPALVIELKYDKTAETGMDQIKKKKYPDRLSHYEGNILLISIDYDKDDKGEGYKKHSCIIENA